MRVTVDKKALGFYRATTMVPVTIGSPYRSMFSSGFRYVTRWGRSSESAAQRAHKFALKVQEWDADWRAKREANRQVFEV